MDTYCDTPSCPTGCASCDQHLTRPCCVLLEVTQRCNLGCPVCFANAGEVPVTSLSGQGSVTDDPSLAVIATWYESLYRRAGVCHIQLSGGEPTLRDDLDAIIELGRERGFSYFQLNTNGLRLAEQPELALRLKAAGLTCVFLQFDGLSESAHRALRGADLRATKAAAIAACREAQLPVILVPTLARGVNECEIMDLVRYGISQSPTVRGIHIQPMARFGRVEVAADRMTLNEVTTLLEEQSGGMIKASHFSGGNAEHPACSFNAHYFITDEGDLEPSGVQRGSCCDPAEGDGSLGGSFTPETADSSCCAAPSSSPRQVPDPVALAQAVQLRRWGTDLDDLPTERPPAGSLDEFLWQTKVRSFAITGMAFMDAQTLDLERLRRCYLFILNTRGVPIPFCAYNIAHRGLTLSPAEAGFDTDGSTISKDQKLPIDLAECSCYCG